MSSEQGYQLFEPFMEEGAAQKIRELCQSAGDYVVYVDQPIQEGLGQGLVRRHDALFNYFMERAALGLNEDLTTLAARINLFRKNYAEDHKILLPGIEPLLHHKGFVEGARALTGRELIVPSMTYGNLLLPGQELPVHTDTPEFRGMSKLDTPEWLLVVMYHAGLFERWRVRIVAGVAFFSDCEGGEFVFYPDGIHGAPLDVAVGFNRGVLLDVDALFHGVKRVGVDGASAPPVEIGMALRFQDDVWELHKEGEVIERYQHDQLRLSIQWKSYCFVDEEERRLMDSHEDDLSFEQVKARLIEDLRTRGKIDGALPDDTDLAMLMIQEYIEFPSHTAA